MICMATKLLIVAFSITTAFGQLLLKRGVSALGGLGPLETLPRFVLNAAKSPWICSAIAVQGIGYLLWMIVVSRVKLGVATASAGAVFYLLIALSAWALFGEPLTLVQWLGILLITIGVACVSLGPI